MANRIPSSVFQNRLGFHYFDDTLHYTERDWAEWLPGIKALGTSWLVLKSATIRAIPEPFLNSCQQAEITPVINFDLSLCNLPNPSELQVLFEAYGHWGVKYVTLFDQPNASFKWPFGSWAQQDLVDRFLDRFLPLANLALQCGLTPIFPALRPGGSYWDTVFLRSALESMERRRELNLLDKLVLSSYALTFHHPLDWGIGGPERWPEAHPYLTPSDQPDQRGFRIFDWYEAICQTVLQKSCPMFLFMAGSCQMPGEELLAEHQVDLAETYVELAKILSSAPSDTKTCLPEQLPDFILAACLWPLTGEIKGARSAQAWFNADGSFGKPAQTLLSWYKSTESAADAKSPIFDHPIQHYLLLPSYEWGIADWHLEVIQPFVKRHRATVGFSLEEASLAQKVTVLGGPQVFSEEALTKLRSTGSLVDRISGDGTTIASLLAER